MLHYAATFTPHPPDKMSKDNKWMAEVTVENWCGFFFEFSCDPFTMSVERKKRHLKIIFIFLVVLIS